MCPVWWYQARKICVQGAGIHKRKICIQCGGIHKRQTEILPTSLREVHQCGGGTVHFKKSVDIFVIKVSQFSRTTSLDCE